MLRRIIHKKFVVLALFAVLVFPSAVFAEADAGSTEPKPLNCSELIASCAADDLDCKKLECGKEPACVMVGSQCKQKTNLSEQEALDAYIEKNYSKPDGYQGPLPDCAFSGTCDDVNDLVLVGINAVQYILGFAGSIALAMFVYGGFMMIISAGNAERVKKGQGILVAAVVGLVIVFSAYLIVVFALNVLGVTDAFNFELV